MIVDARGMEADRSVLDTMVRKFILNALNDITLDIHLVVLGETVNLVDEDLNVDIRIGRLKVEDGVVETGDGFEILILSIDDPDQGTDFSEDGIEVEGRVEEINLSGEIPNLKVHEGAKEC